MTEQTTELTARLHAEVFAAAARVRARNQSADTSDAELDAMHAACCEYRKRMGKDDPPTREMILENRLIDRRQWAERCARLTLYSFPTTIPPTPKQTAIPVRRTAPPYPRVTPLPPGVDLTAPGEPPF